MLKESDLCLSYRTHILFVLVRKCQYSSLQNPSDIVRQKQKNSHTVCCQKFSKQAFFTKHFFCTCTLFLQHVLTLPFCCCCFAFRMSIMLVALTPLAMLQALCHLLLKFLATTTSAMVALHHR